MITILTHSITQIMKIDHMKKKYEFKTIQMMLCYEVTQSISLQTVLVK